MADEKKAPVPAETLKPAPYIPPGAGSAVNAAVSGMQDPDKTRLDEIGKEWNATADQARKEALHQEAEAIRGKYGYSGGADGSKMEFKNPGFPTNPNSPEWANTLNTFWAASQNQIKNQADFAVQQGTQELERAKEEANKQLDQQARQNEKATAAARDNTALYSEARGDRGGIGAAQYNQVDAQSLRNLQQINDTRQKVANDTARAVADLRAKAEFEKADKLFQATQTYLGKLMELQQWQAQFGLQQEQFEEQKRRAQQEYEMALSQITGTFQGKPTWQASQKEREWLAESGNAALANGIKPTKEQAEAMGLTESQVNEIIRQYKYNQQLKAAGVRRSSGGGGSRRGSSSKRSAGGKSSVENKDMDYDGLFAAASRDRNPLAYIKNHYKDFGFSSSTGLEDSYYDWEADQKTTKAEKFNGDYTDVRYNPDEDTVYWAGNVYEEPEDLIAAIKGKAPGMPPTAKDVLLRKLRGMGFNLSGL